MSESEVGMCEGIICPATKRKTYLRDTCSRCLFFCSLLIGFAIVLVLLFIPEFNIPQNAYDKIIGLPETNIWVKGAARDLIDNITVYDSAELCKIHEDSAIITTDFMEQEQYRGVCGEHSRFGPSCLTDDQCKSLVDTVSESGHGIFTGSCNATTETCNVRGWCPPLVARKAATADKPRLDMSQIRDFEINIDSYVTFPGGDNDGQGIKYNNGDRSSSKAKCDDIDIKKDGVPNCTRFKLGSILDKAFGSSYSDLKIRNGATVVVKLSWDCQKGYLCPLTYKFQSFGKQGFHEKEETYLRIDYNHRDYYINYAINLVVLVDSSYKVIKFWSLVAGVSALSPILLLSTSLLCCRCCCKTCCSIEGKYDDDCCRCCCKTCCSIEGKYDDDSSILYQRDNS